MKFINSVLTAILIFSLSVTQAQEKVKGSRNVTVEQTSVEPFTAMEIGEDFEVVIVKGASPIVEIEADDNLHEVIDIDIIGGTLYLQTFKEITRKKRLRVRITFTDALTEIRSKEKAEISGLTDLLFTNITIKTMGDGKFFGTLKTENFTLINNDGGRAELNVTAETATFQLNQKSRVEALVNAPDFTVDLLEDAKAKVEGDTQNLILRADNGSEFTGENLTSQKCQVIMEGRSVASVKVDNEITITAKNNSELTIYDSPKFTIEAFEDKASLFKK